MVNLIPNMHRAGLSKRGGGDGGGLHLHRNQMVRMQKPLQSQSQEAGNVANLEPLTRIFFSIIGNGSFHYLRAP